MEPHEQAETRRQPLRGARGRWLPGTGSPNPGGRPKTPSVLSEIERQLELEADDGRPLRVRIVETLLRRCLRGDMRALALLLARVAPERHAIDANLLHGLRVVEVRDFSGQQQLALERELHALQDALDSTIEAEVVSEVAL